MEIEMLAAKNGDCLILHYGTRAAPGLILIDGGPAGVWDASLKPRLMQLRADRGLGPNQPLVINLLIISHVDDDHINGVIKLLQAIADGRRDNERLFSVERIWHNSFDNILGNDETVEVIRGAGRQFGAASTEGDVESLLRLQAPGDERDATFVLASIEQGDNVRRLAGALNIPINPEFGRGLIQTKANGRPPIQVGELELLIAGPLHDELSELQSAHDEWLKNNPGRQKDATAILTALDDRSVANLSSMAILVRSGQKSLLLTGDARLDKVLTGLESAGAVEKGGQLRVDVLKMPHHGSIRNIDEDTIRRVPAQHYLFSGNGKFGNPDRATFELLLGARPAAQMDFVLSYSLKEIEEGRKRERAKQEAARKKKAEKNGEADAGGADEEDDSLIPVLDPPPPDVTVTASRGISISITP
jgi:hypothetical protein